MLSTLMSSFSCCRMAWKAVSMSRRTGAGSLPSLESGEYGEQRRLPREPGPSLPREPGPSLAPPSGLRRSGDGLPAAVPRLILADSSPEQSEPLEKAAQGLVMAGPRLREGKAEGEKGWRVVAAAASEEGEQGSRGAGPVQFPSPGLVGW